MAELCAPEAQPAALFAAPQGGTVELLGHPGGFPLDLFFSCSVPSAGTETTGAFVCLQHPAALTVCVLFSRKPASRPRQQPVLAVLPERSVRPDRQSVDLPPFFSQNRFLEGHTDGVGPTYFPYDHELNLCFLCHLKISTKCFLLSP